MKSPAPKASTEKGKPKLRRKPLRGPVASTLAGVILVLTLMLPSVWFERAALAQWLATTGSTALGLQPFKLTIEQLDTDALRLTDVAYGDGGPIRVGAVEATYTIGGLISGQLKTLHISGLRLQGNWDDDGIVIHGLDRGDDGKPAAGGTPPIVLPAERLIVEDGQLALETPHGVAEVALAATVARGQDAAYDLDFSATVKAPAGDAIFGAKGKLIAADGGWRITADTEFTTNAYGMDGGLSGNIDALVVGQTVATRMAVSDAHARHDIGGIAAAVGEIEFALGEQGFETLRVALAFDQLNTAGQPLERGTVHVVVADGKADMAIDLRLEDSWARLRAGGRIDDLAQPLMVEAEGELATGQLLPLIADAASGSGRVSLQATGAVSQATEMFKGGEFHWADALSRITGTVLIDVALQDLSLDGALTGGGITGQVDVRFDERGVSATSADGLVATAAVIGPAIAERLPVEWRSLTTGPFVVALGGVAETPMSAHLAATDDGLILLAEGSARLSGAALDLAAQGGGQFVLGDDLRVAALDVPSLSVTVNQLDAAGASLRGEGVFSSIAGSFQTLAGDLAVNLTTSGLPLEGATLDQASLVADGHVTWQDGELSLEPAPGARIRLVGLGWQDQLYIAGPTEFSLARVANEISFEPASGAVRFALETQPSRIVATALLAGAETTELVLELPGVAALGSTVADMLVDVRGASVTASAPAISASSVDARLHFQGGYGFLQIRAGELVYDVDPAQMAPGAIDINAELGPDEVAFAARATALNGAVAAQAEGRHDLASGQGEATFDLDPILFGAFGIQPRDLAPGLGESIGDASGSVALAGRAAWGATGLTSALTVELGNVGFNASGTRVAELTGTIAFDGLLPATTPPGQRLTATIAVGDAKPMQVEVVGSLRSDATLGLESLSLQVAGGRVRAVDAVIDPTALPVDLTLIVESVDLAELLAVVPVEGLSGSGRLSGTVPVRVTDESIAVSDAELTAEGPGVLRYTGAALADQLGGRDDAVGLAMQALSDFRYDSLSLEARKPERGEGVVTLHLTGANPTVLDGYPFVFNINLQSDFDQLAQLALEGVGAADNILRWAQGQSGLRAVVGAGREK